MLSVEEFLHSHPNTKHLDVLGQSPTSILTTYDYEPRKHVEPPSTLKLPEAPCRIAPEDYEKYCNIVTDIELKTILRAISTTSSGKSDKYENTVSAWKIVHRLRPVRFSSRFSALWVRHHAKIIWFSVVDGQFVSFSLRTGIELEIENESGKLPQITLPTGGTTWSTIQQAVVERFESDDFVRAIFAAVMLCTKPTGEFPRIATELLPSQLRHLDTRLCYDSPMDEDMMTVLSDMKTTDNGKTLFFDCGGGHCAKSTVNETMGRISKIQTPLESAPFVESAEMLLPFVFQ